MAAGTLEKAANGEGLLVYFCGGRTVLLPGAHCVVLENDHIVCVDVKGFELARFSTRDVYMCSRKPSPAVPP